MIMTQGRLPIGSVVHLQGRQGLLMVTSVMAEDAETAQLFEYAAVQYPNGVTDGENSVLFNRDAIDCVYFLGLQDAEGLRFQDILAVQEEAFEAERLSRVEAAEGALA